jgi:DMSO/TMAO reductase YedYZ molybdopterin-dependent catalytic subunit
MKRAKMKFLPVFIMALAVLAVMLLGGCGSTTATTPEPTGTDAASETAQPQDDAVSSEVRRFPNYDVAADDDFGQQLAAYQAEMALQYAPEVKTLDNGVQVQRTPTDPTLHNTYTLKADERGCSACHDDLNATVMALPQGHMDISGAGDIDLDLQQCISCHTYSPGYVTEEYQFGSAIHGLHSTAAFAAAGGTCLSCHDANEETGEMALWDLVKYDLFRGIVDTDAAAGTFTWDQTTTIGNEDIYSLDWIYGPNDAWRYEDVAEGVEATDEMFDSWEISISGMVDNPYTVKLKDLIDEGLSVTTTMTMHCTMDPATGGCLANVEVTGIPIRTLLERAGVQDGAVEFYTAAPDNACTYPTTFEWFNTLADDQALLVYEINGQRLSVRQGFPVQAWIAGMGAPNFCKQLCNIDVEADPEEDLYIYTGWVTEDGGYFNKPQTSVFYTKEGQIIDTGVPFTFEGIADAWDDPITAVEISMDRGQTWTTFDTDGAAIGCWVYWRYTFTPETEGAYVFMVRSVTAGGLVSETPATVMINAE